MVGQRGPRQPSDRRDVSGESVRFRGRPDRRLQVVAGQGRILPQGELPAPEFGLSPGPKRRHESGVYARASTTVWSSGTPPSPGHQVLDADRGQTPYMDMTKRAALVRPAHSDRRDPGDSRGGRGLRRRTREDGKAGDATAGAVGAARSKSVHHETHAPGVESGRTVRGGGRVRKRASARPAYGGARADGRRLAMRTPARVGPRTISGVVTAAVEPRSGRPAHPQAGGSDGVGARRVRPARARR